MVALWCVIGLIVATVSVSVLGAAFSVFGIRDLFSGAALAVAAMATALEFAKFVLAAYLHQRWHWLNLLFRSYLLISVVVLSVITSMGIFGFLSNAYQSASAALESATIRAEALKAQEARNVTEVARLNRAIDEVPADRISKKMRLREELEPQIAALAKDSERIAAQIEQSNLQILEVKQKVGPLIYISRAFNINLDDVVKYLILLLVSVFDPLAICLVIASSDAIETRRNKKLFAKADAESAVTSSPAITPAPTPFSEVKTELPPTPAVEAAQDHTATASQGAGEVIHMRFAEDKDRNSV